MKHPSKHLLCSPHQSSEPLGLHQAGFCALELVDFNLIQCCLHISVWDFEEWVSKLGGVFMAKICSYQEEAGSTAFEDAVF